MEIGCVAISFPHVIDARVAQLQRDFCARRFHTRIRLPLKAVARLRELGAAPPTREFLTEHTLEPPCLEICDYAVCGAPESCLTQFLG